MDPQLLAQIRGGNAKLQPVARQEPAVKSGGVNQPIISSGKTNEDVKVNPTARAAPVDLLGEIRAKAIARQEALDCKTASKPKVELPSPSREAMAAPQTAVRRTAEAPVDFLAEIRAKAASRQEALENKAVSQPNTGGSRNLRETAARQETPSVDMAAEIRARAAVRLENANKVVSPTKAAENVFNAPKPAETKSSPQASQPPSHLAVPAFGSLHTQDSDEISNGSETVTSRKAKKIAVTKAESTSDGRKTKKHNKPKIIPQCYEASEATTVPNASCGDGKIKDKKKGSKKSKAVSDENVLNILGTLPSSKNTEKKKPMRLIEADKSRENAVNLLDEPDIPVPGRYIHITDPVMVQIAFRSLSCGYNP